MEQRKKLRRSIWRGYEWLSADSSCLIPSKKIRQIYTHIYWNSMRNTDLCHILWRQVVLRGTSKENVKTTRTKTVTNFANFINTNTLKFALWSLWFPAETVKYGRSNQNECSLTQAGKGFNVRECAGISKYHLINQKIMKIEVWFPSN